MLAVAARRAAPARAHDRAAAGAAALREISVPLGTISRVHHNKPLRMIVVECKDVRVMHLALDADKGVVSGIVKAIRRLAFPDDPRRLFAFSHEVDLDAGEQLSGWALYQPRREFERQGCRLDAPRPTWVLYEQDAAYSLSPTYPRHRRPAALTPEELELASRYRSQRRLPALTWRCPATGAVLARSAQPCAGPYYRPSEADEPLDLQRRRRRRRRPGDRPAAARARGDGRARPRVGARARRRAAAAAVPGSSARCTSSTAGPR